MSHSQLLLLLLLLMMMSMRMPAHHSLSSLTIHMTSSTTNSIDTTTYRLAA